MQPVDEMPVIAVDSDELLSDLAGQWAQLTSLALDTEFMRTNTFYPKLGLLQVSDAEQCYLIDPLKISDWQPLIDLFKQQSLTFILHSAGEDLVLLYTALGSVPVKLFDTQVAAAFLGYGFSLSYQALVKVELGKDVDKDETRSDWLRRPLSDAQLRYAALDVRYLHDLQRRLEKELLAEHKMQWFEAECQQLIRTAINSEAPELWGDVYKGISNAWRLSKRGLTLLQRLAYWREQQARRKNRPRNWIAKDAELFTIAAEMAKTDELELKRLQRLEGVAPGLLQRQGERLLKAMQQPIGELPDSVAECLNPPMPIEFRKVIKGLQQATSEIADEYKIAPELLARKRQILALLENFKQDKALCWKGDMAGWRKNLLQEKFEQVVENGQ